MLEVEGARECGLMTPIAIPGEPFFCIIVLRRRDVVMTARSRAGMAVCVCVCFLECGQNAV